MSDSAPRPEPPAQETDLAEAAPESVLVEPRREQRTLSDVATDRAATIGTAVAGWVRSLGVTPAEEVSPHQPPPGVVGAEVPDDKVRRLDLITILSAVSGLVGTLLIAASAPEWRLAAPSWRLLVPGIPHPGSSFVAASFFTAGLVLLGFGWVGIIGRAERLPGSTRRKWVTVLAVGALWTLPVLLGPPLLSNDVYSYAAQGEMASRGIDPTAPGNGPGILGNVHGFTKPVDPTWRWAPAPYGPVWIGLSEGVVVATGHSPAAAVWGFRALALLGVALAAIGVVQIARHYKVPDTVALAVGIVNPLVIIYLIGGSHNDALMMGLLCLGVAAALRDKRVLAVVLIALATAVKLPAAPALVFVAWHFAGPGASWRKRIEWFAKVGLGAGAIIGALCVLTGTGIGWITALSGTGKVMDTFSLMTMVGYFATDAAEGLRITNNPELLVPYVRAVGVLIAGAASFALMAKSDRIGMTRAIGLSMLLVVVLGPVVWPWYLPAGFALVAAAGLGRYRPSYLVCCVAATALVWPTSVDPIYPLVEYQRILSFGVILLIAGLCLVAQKWARVREVRRAIRRQAAFGQALAAPEAALEVAVASV